MQAEVRVDASNHISGFCYSSLRSHDDKQTVLKSKMCVACWTAGRERVCAGGGGHTRMNKSDGKKEKWFLYICFVGNAAAYPNNDDVTYTTDM